MTQSEELQREYYDATASAYDVHHVEEEHIRAFEQLSAFIETHHITSVCDVGAGTGRAMEWLRQRFPDLVVKGVEPVESLRRRAYEKGLSPSDLMEGDGYRLPFPDDSFDLVCEFAVLHHVRRPDQVIAEMSRVARKAVAISDCNFIGQGPRLVRYLKFLIFAFGLWPIADWLKTRGKGYTYSEGDGIAYSYSVFQDFRLLKGLWRVVDVQATSEDAIGRQGLIINAGHLLVIASERRAPAQT